jgi:hypothetical protein
VEGVGYFIYEMETDTTALKLETDVVALKLETGVAALELETDTTALELETDTTALDLEMTIGVSHEISKQEKYSAANICDVPPLSKDG